MLKNFRPCAGAVVFNSEGKVFVGNRIDIVGNNWQFPQGGIEQGESPQSAARRELFEETNITSVELVHIDEKPRRYEFPDNIKQKFQKKGIFCDGQDIYFALFFFVGKDDEINVATANPEFKEYEWQTLDFAIQNIVPFKQQVYQNMANKFAPLIEQHLCNIS